MKSTVRIITALIFGLGLSSSFAQEHNHGQQQGGATDHSQHAATGMDHMAHLDADLEAIRNTADLAKRKQMLLQHLQMMREHMQQMHASMDHGGMAAGEKPGGTGHDMHGMNEGEGAHGGMMQHHQQMGKMMEHMLAMQELMLGLIETNP